VEPALSATNVVYRVTPYISTIHEKNREKAWYVCLKEISLVSGFPATIAHVDHIPPLRATCPVYLRILNSSIVKISGEEEKP
jgi:hypothetical protein